MHSDAETALSGGSKPGERRGGRQAGTPNKRTTAREIAFAEQVRKIEAAIGDAFAGDAHAMLVATYKDLSQPIELRVDAAKAAIRYEKPALASTEIKTVDPLSTISDEQLSRLISMCEAMGAAGTEGSNRS